MSILLLWLVIMISGSTVLAEGPPLVDVGLLTHLAGTAGAAYPQMTPEGDAVAYYMSGDLWLLRFESQERVVIILSPNWESRFSISPDGETVAFTSERGFGGRTLICLSRIGFGEISCLPPLAEITYVCGPQAWSADSLLVCGMEPERIERLDAGITSTLSRVGLRWRAWIWEVKPSGEKVRTLMEDEGLLYAVWSPDRSKILYTSNADKQPTIWLLNTATLERKPLIQNAFFPTWSPDGELIAFVRDGELWIASAEGDREQQITNGLDRVVTPAWSPHGDKIFFARLPPLDEDRSSAGIYYVTVTYRRELPATAIATTIALTTILVALLFRLNIQTKKAPTHR